MTCRFDDQKKHIVVIDPGHGGKDPGGIGKNLKEKDITLKIAILAQRFLSQDRYIKTLLTRSVDGDLSLWDRIAMANDEKADIFVSIHVNAWHTTQPRGIETYSFPNSEQGKILRGHLHRQVMYFFPRWPDRGEKEAEFFVLKETSMPAALIECGFITNPVDERELQSKKTLKRFALGIAEGIKDYFEEVR